MADISKVELPNGAEYNIKDEVARAMTLEATYTAGTKNLTLTFSTAASIDSEEF